MNKNDSSSTKESHSDAINLLTADHKKVKKLFKEYQFLVDNQADSKQRGLFTETKFARS